MAAIGRRDADALVSAEGSWLLPNTRRRGAGTRNPLANACMCDTHACIAHTDSNGCAAPRRRALHFARLPRAQPARQCAAHKSDLLNFQFSDAEFEAEMR